MLFHWEKAENWGQLMFKKKNYMSAFLIQFFYFFTLKLLKLAFWHEQKFLY